MNMQQGTSETWMPRGEHIRYLMEAGIGDRVRCMQGQFLFMQGDVERYFYLLLDGKVHVYALSEDGHECTFNIMGAGSVIGEAGAFTGLPRQFSARVLESSELLVWKAPLIEEYFRHDPQFAVAMTHLLSMKQHQALGRLKEIAFSPPAERVMRLFAELADMHRESNSNHADSVRLNLTHEQIGGLTNLSRVTVTRTLNRLKREGQVELANRFILLKRPPTHRPQLR